MLKRLVSLLLLAVVIFVWPVQTQEATSDLDELRKPARIEAAAAAEYLDELSSRGVSLDAQGIRVESLDGGLILADHQGDQVFNPASVIKVATSLAALERFGTDHRFETAFYVDGTIDEAGVLHGDLILSSDGDPVMGTVDLNRLAREVIRAGVRRVDGNFVISGPFTVGNLYSRRRVDPYVVRTLRRIGIRVPDEVTYGPAAGTRVAQRFSDPLLEILFDQNARSNNTTADRVGEAVGGPRAVEDYLVRKVGIRAEDVRIERTSGLRRNQITPEGTIMVFRKLTYWMEARGLYPEHVLPVAGMDRGTLRLRFNNRTHRGAVVAKTGTLVSTDDGISTLAGVIYTEDHGPLLFAIFNSRGPVLQYRRFQDNFVKDLLSEYGGMPSINASTHRSGS
jgi:D-alanyl-D-alanine carboxypeptidase/D-alanyl-D-alanine-endopeptidase (penicillin-binding protein 4)